METNPFHAVPAATPHIGRAGELFEIRDGAPVPVPMPHPDCVPLAIDAEGRLIAARTGGDRQIRRYSGAALDATYPFRLDGIRSLAVSGNRVIVVHADGRAQGLDEETVPRIDYTYRLKSRFAFVDARDQRIAFAGDEIVVCDWEGRVLERGPGARKVRLLPAGYARIDDAVQVGGRSYPGTDLAHDWVVGERLARLA